MPVYTEFICGTCGETRMKELLYVKRLIMAPLKNTDLRVKSRIIEYICTECLRGDSDWNSAPMSGPGHVSHAQERIKKRKSEQ